MEKMTLSEQIVRLEGTVDRIDKSVERLDHAINGNSRPGMSQRLEQFITEQFRQNDRITAIEEHIKEHKSDWQWILTTAIAVCAIAVSAVALFLG